MNTNEVDIAMAGYRVMALALTVAMCDADPGLRNYIIKRLQNPCAS